MKRSFKIYFSPALPDTLLLFFFHLSVIIIIIIKSMMMIANAYLVFSTYQEQL